MEAAHGLAEELAEGLVGGLSGGAGVDEVAGFDAEGDATVDAAFPTDASFGEAMRVFFVEEGFGFPVAHLLFEVFPRGGAAVVPDEGGAGEAKGEADIAESPAEVDIIAGGLEDGVEAADLFEGRFFDGEMATGEVLGGGVIEHDVGGGAGGGGGEGEAAGVGLGGEVGSADGGVVGLGIGAGEPGEPLGIGLAVVVGVSENLAGGLFGSVISGGGEAAGIEVEGADAGHFIEESGCFIGGAVVDDDDFEVGVVEGAAGIEASGEAGGAVAGADDDGEAGGIFWKWVGESEVAESGEDGLFGEVAAKEAE